MKKYKNIIKSIFFTSLIFLIITPCLKSQIIIENTQVLSIDNGVYLNVEGDIQNHGWLNADSLSFVKLSGGLQEISGSQALQFGQLIIAGNDSKQLNGQAQEFVYIKSALVFNAQKIEINNNDLVLLSAAAIVNANNQRYVVTAGNGRLIKKAVPHNIDFLFPVGTSSSSYTPVSINYSGVLDTFAVRVLDGVNPPDQTAVQKTYLIKSAHPGLSLADISLAWNTADEGSLFIPAQTLMWQQQTAVWNMLNNPAGASNNNPATDWLYKADNVQFLSNATDSFILKSSAPPDILSQPHDVAVCETQTATFSVTATGFGVLTYQWQINCTGTWSDINNGGFAPSYSGATDSILVIDNVPYALNGCDFRCIVSTIAGQTISDPATLIVYPQPLVYINGDSLYCEGEYGTLEALGNATSFLWNTGDTTQEINIFPMPPSQTYSVTVTNNYFCENSAQKTVYVTPEFDVNLTSDFEPDHTIFVGQLIIITALPSGYYNYNFFIDNNLVQSGGSNIYTTSSLTSDANIYVTAYINNCEANDSLLVKVKPLPNAFTPYDKDGKNDIFGKGLDLEIFNRWGQVLYKGVEGWDGTYNGKQISPGTYFYHITLNPNKKNQSTIIGSILLISN